MAVPSEIVTEETCLGWDGFPSILWTILQDIGYEAPPIYYGKEYSDRGVRRCRVRLTAPPPPVHPEWEALETVVEGHRFSDTWEMAALEGITLFVGRHRDVLEDTVALSLPPIRGADAQWWASFQATPRVFAAAPTVAAHFFARWMKAALRLIDLQRMSQQALLTFATEAMTTSMRGDMARLSTTLDLASKESQIVDLVARTEELTVENNFYIEQAETLRHQLEAAQVGLHHAQVEIEGLQAQQNAPAAGNGGGQAEADAQSDVDEEMLPALRPDSPSDDSASVNDLDDF